MASKLGWYYEDTDWGTLKQHIVFKETNNINSGLSTKVIKGNTFSEVNKSLNFENGIRRSSSIEEKQVKGLEWNSLGGK